MKQKQEKKGRSATIITPFFAFLCVAYDCFRNKQKRAVGEKDVNDVMCDVCHTSHITLNRL